MIEEPKQGNFPVPPQAEPDVAALIKKMHQQLIFLEKKIDILINQSQGASPREKYFSKPYRSFDRSGRHDKAERDGRPGEKGPDQGRNFEKRHGEKNRGFDYGEKRKFDPKKKPFYYRRKDRG
ncbi:MAG: hypothetical protein V1863_00590 [Candidatus Omnitrophota bacterium]